MKNYIPLFLCTLLTSTVASIGLGSLPAAAASLTWTFRNTVFDDGGTLTGSFDYDADTNLYSNMNILTSGGSASPFRYQPTSWCGQATGNNNSCFIRGTVIDEQFWVQRSGHYEDVLFMSFQSGLTNAGGVVSLNTSHGEEVFSEDPPTLRNFVTGEVVAYVPATAVPESGTIAGITAIAGLVGTKQLQRKRNQA